MRLLKYTCHRFEREVAEAGVLLTSDEITKSKHETPFNAIEQDNSTTSSILKAQAIKVSGFSNYYCILMSIYCWVSPNLHYLFLGHLVGRGKCFESVKFLIIVNHSDFVWSEIY